MAKLYFYYSAMNAGKTTTLLQSAHNYHERGMRVAILTPRLDDRAGRGVVASRIGLKADGVAFDRATDLQTLIAQDLDTATIAERLFISPWTVQDHCKAIFEKTGTRTRRELRAVIFFTDHLPAIVVRTPLDAGGHLDVIERPSIRCDFPIPGTPVFSADCRHGRSRRRCPCSKQRASGRSAGARRRFAGFPEAWISPGVRAVSPKSPR